MIIQPAAHRRADNKIHQQESQDIKDGTHRPYDQHEPPQVRSIPGAGSFQEFLIHVVPRDSRTGDIIDQVQQNQLDGSHGKERKKRTGRQNGKHISKIGRCRHLDILNHISIDFSAFPDAVLQNQQIFIQKHHIGAFPGNIHRRIHGYPGIRHFHSSRVVDPVSHISHHVAVSPEYLHDPRLLLRRQLCKYRCFFSFPAQLLIRHGLQIRTGENMCRIHPHLGAYRTGYPLVIPCQDFYPHAAITQRLQRGSRCFLGRIQKRQISHQHHIRFILHGKSPCRCRIRFLCHSNHPESLGIVLRGLP